MDMDVVGALGGVEDVAEIIVALVKVVAAGAIEATKEEQENSAQAILKCLADGRHALCSMNDLLAWGASMMGGSRYTSQNDSIYVLARNLKMP